MRVALVQLTVTDDPVANLAATLGFVRQAQTQGAQFILTPECTNGLWSNRAAQKAQLRREEDDPTLSALRDEAAKLGVWLLIGSLALLTGDADGRFANRSFMISPDGAVVAIGAGLGGVYFDRFHQDHPWGCLWAWRIIRI